MKVTSGYEMAKSGNTWFKIKRAKLRAQDVERACGSNKRRSAGDNGRAGRALTAPPRPNPAMIEGCEVKVCEAAEWRGVAHSIDAKLYRREGRDGGAQARVAGMRTGMRERGVVVQVVDTEWKLYRKA
jgi:hypothetical protein